MKLPKLFVFALATALGIGQASAAVITVGNFGEQGWNSDDTRTAAGVDLVGINNTNAPKPGQIPTAADDLAIAQQIKFVAGPAGSTYGGAVSIDGTANNNGKSNYSVISPVTGFGAASDLVDPAFSAVYEMYKQHTGNGSTLAFKIGIQSSDWGTGPGDSQETFAAVRSGESAWDLVLVHIPTVVNNTWETVSLDHDSGTWFLYDQAGNPFFTPPGGAAGMDKTLDGWNADGTWGPKLFGAGAKISSIQFGLGSFQPIAIGYVDYLQTSLLNGGDAINFVPEPSALALAGFGLVGVGLAALRRRARRAS
jgi:hypothetical protein